MCWLVRMTIEARDNNLGGEVSSSFQCQIPRDTMSRKYKKTTQNKRITRFGVGKGGWGIAFLTLPNTCHGEPVTCVGTFAFCVRPLPRPY